MQWYVFLIAILASVLVTWVTLEVLSRPIRALIDLRRKALQQIVTFGSLSLPKPRETAVCSREIREYDQAITNVREAQRILHDLGSQLLAFSENEPAIRIAVGLFGLNIVAAPVGRSKSPGYGHLKLPHLMIVDSAAEQR